MSYGADILRQMLPVVDDHGNGKGVLVLEGHSFLFTAVEFATAQTGVVLIPAPGAGKRIVVKAVALAGNGVAGEIVINGTLDAGSVIVAKAYITKYNTMSQTGIAVHLDENTAVTITTTTGTDKALCKLNYLIETV